MASPVSILPFTSMAFTVSLSAECVAELERGAGVGAEQQRGRAEQSGQEPARAPVPTRE